MCGAVMGVIATKLTRHSFAHVPFFTLDDAIVRRDQWLLAVLGWIVFSIYWEIAARSATAATHSESSGSRAVHVSLTNAALLLTIVPFRGLGRFVPPSFLVMSTGVAAEAIGLFLAIWARRHLGRHWSGEITIKREHQLIRSGPYRLVRHPIYTGILTMYVGTAVVTGGWLGVIGVALAAVAYWRKIRLEETNLQVAFGEAYRAYQAQTWALLPWIFTL